MTMRKMVARRAHNVRNGHYWSLRLVFDNGRDSEFARIRQERGGWNAWSDDEEYDKAFKAACFRAGRDAPLDKLLAEIRSTYERIEEEDRLWAEQNGMHPDERHC